MHEILLVIWNVFTCAFIVYVVWVKGDKYKLEKRKKRFIIYCAAGLIAAHGLLSAEYGTGLGVFLKTLLFDMGMCLIIVLVLCLAWKLGNMYIVKRVSFRGTQKQVEEWKKKMKEKDKRISRILAGMIIR